MQTSVSLVSAIHVDVHVTIMEKDIGLTEMATTNGTQSKETKKENKNNEDGHGMTVASNT